ncbi:hypothetical protein NPIL_538291 [Nephila pilipes]|uniref:Uncharacterized protein n=1 Tax=Nephila pilipes TaxID=299642 RepID=A0A8X6TLV1_NEPPI|nr:hypothetical protein NPIL_538291 [Nephila pilipes]
MSSYLEIQVEEMIFHSSQQQNYDKCSYNTEEPAKLSDSGYSSSTLKIRNISHFILTSYAENKHRRRTRKQKRIYVCGQKGKILSIYDSEVISIMKASGSDISENAGKKRSFDDLVSYVLFFAGAQTIPDTLSS